MFHSPQWWWAPGGCGCCVFLKMFDDVSGVGSGSGVLPPLYEHHLHKTMLESIYMFDKVELIYKSRFICLYILDVAHTR